MWLALGLVFPAIVPLILIYPKPYSIYLRGTIEVWVRISLTQTFIRLMDNILHELKAEEVW